MIFLHGDIHGDVTQILGYIKAGRVVPGDTIVLLGDVGLNFYCDKDESKRKDALEKTGVNFLCVHGNHEKRPGTMPSYGITEWNGGKVYVEAEFPHLCFAVDGSVYDLEGHSAIVMGGAYSVDKYFRLTHDWPWFPDEQPSEEIKAAVEAKLDELGWKADIVLSHTCPAKYVPFEKFLPFIDQHTVDRSTEEWLDTIEDRLEYDAWYCGHWHINKRIDGMHFLFDSLEQLPEIDTHRKQ